MNNQLNSYHINIITLFTVGLGTPLASINAFFCTHSPSRRGLKAVSNGLILPKKFRWWQRTPSLSSHPCCSLGRTAKMSEEHIEFRNIQVSVGGDDLLALIDQQLKPNAIRTTKYTMLNWLPKSILEQFRRVANAYFLGISVLMILGSYATYLFISPLDPFSTIATLTVILLITSCKEGYEDLLRRRSDKYENNREVTVVTFEKDADGNTALRETVKKSKRLRPGDIVKLTGQMPAPADLLLILTSLHHDGNKCYVETANIDGETNLKLREAPSALCTELHEQIAEGAPVPELFRGTIEIEPPNANIHKFVGTLRLEAAQHPVPIDAQNIVLRSALFSNTDWAYGIVVYAGQETKIQMNSLHAPSKMSKLEKNLNTAIIIIFTAQVVLVSVSVLSVYLLGFNNTEDLPYVFPPGTGRGSVLPLWLELWFVFFLLYNNFIPLSLYVTIEIVNLGQSFLIGADREMYHEGLDVPCTVRASNLVQELGMVSNVFTDKTGTLTRNEMKMVKFVLNGTIYDVRPPSSAPSSAASTRPNTPTITHAPTSASAASDPALATPGADSSGVGLPRPPQSSSKPARRHVRLERDATCSSDSSSDSDGEARKDSNKRKGMTIDSRSAEPAAQAAEPAASDAADMFQLLRALMTCHSVVRESNGTYRAESPDELALVQGASESYDCSLVERGSREMTVRIAGREHSYAILAVNPFDADRKRMSVLLRDSASGQYMIVCKGADNIMLPLCAATTTALSKAGRARVEGALLQLANLGLRTLVVGQRYLDHAEAQDWLKRYRTSMVATTNRDAQIADTAALLERDLDLLGVTAIEDRLQDEVPEVISDLARAGIIVWMLTGDKLETAVNIGHSCNLVQATSQVVSIANMTSAEEFAAALKAEYEKVEALTAGASSSGAGGSSGGGGAQPPSERRNRRSSSVARGEAGNIVLILDGPSFSYFNGDDPAQCQQLLGIGRRCRSVIACRLTPMQKRELVALTKNDLTAVPKATTLSIGDGANDVSMILEANVGVGIFGKEGRQAANNADFAIGEFKFLRRLLLVHGRYNYIRQSRVFLYSMHKNMVLTMTLFWFSYFTAVSGASPYESWIYSGFNFILGLPIIFYGILDRDLAPEFALRYPQVYSTGRTNVLLNVGSICQWICNAMVYAVVVCLMSYNVLFPSFYYMGLYTAGTTVMIGLVLSLQCKVAFFHNQWSYPQVNSMLFSFFAMYLYYMLIAVAVNDYYGEATMAYAEPVLWLWSLLTVPLTTIFIDWAAYFARYCLCPTQEMLFREFELQEQYDDWNRLVCVRGLKAGSGSGKGSAGGSAGAEYEMVRPAEGTGAVRIKSSGPAQGPAAAGAAESRAEGGRRNSRQAHRVKPNAGTGGAQAVAEIADSAEQSV